MTYFARVWLALGAGLFLASPICAGEDPQKVQTSLVFLTELSLAEMTTDMDALAHWVKPILEATESRFQNVAVPRTIVVQITLHRDRPAEVAIAGKPALAEAETAGLLQVVDVAKAPRTRVCDCSLRIVAKVNGGHPDEKAALVPDIKTPDEIFVARIQSATTAERYTLMRRWARTEALPILAAIGARSDARFEGVRRLGKAIDKLDPAQPIDVAAITERNSDYWRAMMEMRPGIPFVPAVHMALLVAEGEMDRARKIAELSGFFDAKKSGPSYVLGVLRTMSGLFFKDLEARVAQGVALHDQGKLNEAIAVYDEVLKIHPKCAWAIYEKFHTRRTMALNRGNSLEQIHADWPRVRKQILECDPLYPTLAMADGRDEVYEFGRRFEIGRLFKKLEEGRRDLVRYADIALDLKVFGIAGMLYWNSILLVPPDDYEHRPLLEYFLYCLEQLGVRDIKDAFRGDHEAAFARIEAERRERKERSPAFQKGGNAPDAGERKRALPRRA